MVALSFGVHVVANEMPLVFQCLRRVAFALHSCRGAAVEGVVGSVVVMVLIVIVSIIVVIIIIAIIAAVVIVIIILVITAAVTPSPALIVCVVAIHEPLKLHVVFVDLYHRVAHRHAVVHDKLVLPRAQRGEEADAFDLREERKGLEGGDHRRPLLRPPLGEALCLLFLR